MTQIEPPEHTWTFYGHWDNDELIIEYATPGDTTPDPRIDTGHWEQGLWCDTGTGTTLTEAQHNATAPYLTDQTPEHPTTPEPTIEVTYERAMNVRLYETITMTITPTDAARIHTTTDPAERLALLDTLYERAHDGQIITSSQDSLDHDDEALIYLEIDGTEQPT